MNRKLCTDTHRSSCELCYSHLIFNQNFSISDENPFSNSGVVACTRMDGGKLISETSIYSPRLYELQFFTFHIILAKCPLTLNFNQVYISLANVMIHTSTNLMSTIYVLMHVILQNIQSYFICIYSSTIDQEIMQDISTLLYQSFYMQSHTHTVQIMIIKPTTSDDSDNHSKLNMKNATIRSTENKQHSNKQVFFIYYFTIRKQVYLLFLDFTKTPYS